MYTFIQTIEEESAFNDLCVLPNTGLMFIANEGQKIQSYYIPNLGSAPKWCGFLDNVTEELEELEYDNIYDNYKFITEKELEELGLSHLKGTNLLRAHMHGHFMDIRLYKKAKSISQPTFSYDDYKKKKIQEKIDEEQPKFVELSKLPAVNKELALKYMEAQKEQSVKKKKNIMTDIFKDERFKNVFENPDYQIDYNSQEYALNKPLTSYLEKSTHRKLQEMEKMNAKTADNDGMLFLLLSILLLLNKYLYYLLNV